MNFQLLVALRRWLVEAPWDRQPDTSASKMDRIREAIQSKTQIVAYRRKCFLIFCPHALASSVGGFYVLAFVILGGTADDEDFHSPRRWRWIPVSELAGVTEREGYWFSAPRDSRPRLYAATIEFEAA